mgnify:CR=1 FL=1
MPKAYFNIQEIQNKDRVDVILANPPFGGNKNKQLQERKH